MLQRIQDNKTRSYYLLLSCILIFFFSNISYALEWKEISPGIQYINFHQDLLTPWSYIHVFKINLKKNRLNLIKASQLQQKNGSVNDFLNIENGLIAINGGFFDQNYHPLGLRINNHQQYSKLKKISWWGVFYIINNKPYITNIKNFENNPNINFAIQSGPRLIINGKIPSLKKGHAERTALGITKNKEVILLVTENSPLSTTALAHLMKSHPISCQYAINLDGGSSTQLKTNFNTLQLYVRGFSNVSDAIVVTKNTS